MHRNTMRLGSYGPVRFYDAYRIAEGSLRSRIEPTGLPPVPTFVARLAIPSQADAALLPAHSASPQASTRPATARHRPASGSRAGNPRSDLGTSESQLLRAYFRLTSRAHLRSVGRSDVISRSYCMGGGDGRDVLASSQRTAGLPSSASQTRDVLRQQRYGSYVWFSKTSKRYRLMGRQPGRTTRRCAVESRAEAERAGGRNASAR
ncbi:hypothetical protein PSPO01_08405 [Paraphaeosphaeria sporulosa]